MVKGPPDVSHCGMGVCSGLKGRSRHPAWGAKAKHEPPDKLTKETALRWVCPFRNVVVGRSPLKESVLGKSALF